MRDVAICHMLTTHLLALCMGGLLMQGIMEGSTDVAKKQATGWAGLDESGFLDSEMLILSDDGDMACFVPMTEPVMVTEKTDWGPKEKAVVQVVRCGDAEISNPDAWTVQSLGLGKRQTRAYRRHAEGNEGKIILRMIRHGAAGDQGTRYEFQVADPDLPAEHQKRCAALLDESQK